MSHMVNDRLLTILNFGILYEDILEYQHFRVVKLTMRRPYASSLFSVSLHVSIVLEDLEIQHSWHPFHENIPPLRYGGVERIVSFLAEELVTLGHEVTLYACGGSVTTARLIESWPRSFRDDGIGFVNDVVKGPYGRQLHDVFSDRQTQGYDIVHVHHGTEPFHFDAMVPTMQGPILWTDHGLLDYPGKPDVLRYLQRECGVKLTAISEWQRSTLPSDIDCFGVVHNGIPADLLMALPQPEGRKYLAFLGRVAPEKGIEDAIEIAQRSGYHLKLAAKIDDVFRDYYDAEIVPRLKKHDLDFVGEIDDAAKSGFLSGAAALLFPVHWEEPFGMVMIEAFACGTPVIAYRRGAVDEVVVDGVTGFKVSNVDEAVATVAKLGTIDTHNVRQVFERSFTARMMANSYLELYERLLKT
ncbi:hypothetical protein LTR10_018015 [Elasticomyces elasticus]|uniref:Glycosyl transferase family 1 domain-containing protein n=1 Tax=Exophiala sideris TaxID=1016849 RepID=A0ABR0JBM7_9EURO|nr:hypothetical protein LTR10_018015 [Elasticomyces elasticus]KAK5026112.1 hypothetical protein LTS07_007637 [Exophiala sideris]KAK5032366.1 hypothetical protein LTR13_007189 [Exophiala sideris]KAK5059522.1 hypothetical protein LTR69_006111 [Exophiala sideris]KAK5186684.1 hypothetical protein LTR44_000690 [Eurotiomycetes sp. CCFEE 6388]